MRFCIKEKDYQKKRGQNYLVWSMQEVNHQLFSRQCKKMNVCIANEEASEQKIRELLEKFDLEEYAEYHPMILSGGQRQRLAICQAVMGGKKLLIFENLPAVGF